MKMSELESFQRTVFYPYCGIDLLPPIEILGRENLKYIFCDIRRYRNWKEIEKSDASVTLLRMNAWDVIERLPQIDILFYRRDGMSEGGSGVEVLGDEYLTKLLSKSPPDGGIIITDGSNAFGHRLDELELGLVKCAGFKITLAPNQEFENHGLMTFDIHN